MENSSIQDSPREFHVEIQVKISPKRSKRVEISKKFKGFWGGRNFGPVDARKQIPNISHDWREKKETGEKIW